MAVLPKLDELVATLTSLEARVAELEAWRVTHNAGMARRQQQIDGQQQIIDRDRWLRTLRGRR